MALRANPSIESTSAQPLLPTIAAGFLALVAGGLWAALLSTDSLLSEPLSVPGSMAAGLLLAASYPAWSLSRWSETSAMAFPALLLLISFSELFAIHHDVEAASGLDWQTLYLPVLLSTLLIGWNTHAARATATGHRIGFSVALLAWIGALMFEAFQWRLVEGDALHSQLGNAKDALEVIAAAAVFLVLAVMDRQSTTRT